MCYRETHLRLDELAGTRLGGTRKDCLRHATTVSLLVIDDLGMKRLPHTAAEELLESVMRRSSSLGPCTSRGVRLPQRSLPFRCPFVGYFWGFCGLALVVEGERETPKAPEFLW